MYLSIIIPIKQPIKHTIKIKNLILLILSIVFGLIIKELIIIK
jgi:hypothetical protein